MNVHVTNAVDLAHAVSAEVLHQLRLLPRSDYLDSVKGDAGRAAGMYMGTDRLVRGTSAPDAVMDAYVEIAESWLTAVAAAECDTPAARGAKLQALLHYLTVEAEDRLELSADIETIVRQLAA